MSAAVATATQRRQTGWVVLAIVAGNLLIDTVEVSSFFVALPTLATRFDLSMSEILLLCASFPLAFAVGIPLAQPMADRVGAQRLFVVALLAFAAFSVVTITSSVVLISLARVVKGLAAGLTTPLGNGIIGAAFASKADSDRAGRIYSLIGGIGFVGGMAITAPLVTASWWAGISWTGPLAALLAVVAATLLPRGLGEPGPKVPAAFATMRWVLLGAIVAAGVAVAPIAAGLRLAAALAAVGIVVAGTAIGVAPALRPRATRPFLVNAVTAGAFNALFLAFFATALLLLCRNGYSPVEASLVLCPMALAMACATPLTRHISRMLSAVWAISGATVCCAVAYVWFALDVGDGRGPHRAAVLGMATLIGLAFILGFVTFNMRAVSFASPSRLGSALSWYQVLVQSGAAISIPLVASASAILGSASVTGWPLVIAAGGIGLCALSTYMVASARSERSADDEGGGLR